MVDDDDRRGFGGWRCSGCVRGGVPLRWVVEVVAGEHLDGGEVDGGGRRFGCDWDSPKRGSGVKLETGIDEWLHEMVTGGF